MCKVFCNRASIATVTNHNHEPISPYPRGTGERTTKPEVTSEEEFRVTKTEIERDVGQQCWRSDKPEEDLWMETGERETPGTQEEQRDGETERRKTAKEDRRRPETGEQLLEDPKIPREMQRRNKGSRHVPGGAWHTQVRSYFTLKLLPEWLKGGRSLEGVEGGLGKRCLREGDTI
ncbi:hypothetical protein NDU88_011032 [Pleurodeles waltl]|uniref:Uncharacterized protein n=1 Tax=Pleurodeles waltl TaxID=8319 RepID=A0AAV7PZQ4_PLEWA|nr:hypothetical protein NDU88_011032 [Pleurodeles waltl]